MQGKLYGIGVGPGDPELLTLKAVRLIRECQVVAVPGEKSANSVAYQIVEAVVPELKEKEVLAIPMPMTKEHDVLRKNHKAGADRIIEYLKDGKDVAFLTLGDPTVYSTYIYLHKMVGAAGYETEIVSGVTSFCAAAARVGDSLVEKSELLHIVPSSYGVENALALHGTKVLMKAGKTMGKVKEELQRVGAEAVMIENCGMENEKVYRTVEEIPENAGYYSLIIVKERKTL